MIKFDKEYATDWSLEYLYLKELGILPSYIKPSNEKREKTTYKYTKTCELFEALAKFYTAK